ncbi:unnamed protein product, partial [Prorocentrum cordatum]
RNLQFSTETIYKEAFNLNFRRWTGDAEDEMEGAPELCGGGGRRRAVPGAPRCTARLAAGGAGGDLGGGGLSDADLAALRQRIDGLRAIESATWRRVSEGGGAVPPGRLRGSLTALGDGSRRLCLFGGVSTESGRMLNSEPGRGGEGDGRTGEWHRVTPQGALPPGRAHHDAVVVGGRWLVVHGGLLDSGCRDDDTWRLDLWASRPAWEQLGLGPVVGMAAPRPVPRFHHSLVTTEDGKIVLFGGHSWQREALDDAWVMDLGEEGSLPASLTLWREIGGAQRPEARAYHAMSAVGRQVVVSGGELQDGGGSAELWALDTRTEEWCRVDAGESGWAADARGGAGRMRHATCHLGHGVLAVCGGHGGTASEPRPTRCQVLRLAEGGEARMSCRLLQRLQGSAAAQAEELPPGEAGPRLEATLLRLPEGPLVLFGGNTGELTDEFGDGYHQRGPAETLVADVAGGGDLGEWREASRGAPKLFAALGCSVAALAETSEVVVVDTPVGSGPVRVHALMLR